MLTPHTFVSEVRMSTKELLLKFSELYKTKYGFSYPIAWGRDMAMLKRLVGIYGIEQLPVFFDYYLNKINDPFLAQAGHTLPLLRTGIPKILAAIAADEKGKAEPASDFDRLEEARKRL